MKRRVAVMVAGTLGAAAFAFPAVGFARTHSAAGQAARCQALIARFNSLRNAEAGANANTLPIIQSLADRTYAQIVSEGCI